MSINREEIAARVPKPKVPTGLDARSAADAYGFLRHLADFPRHEDHRAHGGFYVNEMPLTIEPVTYYPWRDRDMARHVALEAALDSALTFTRDLIEAHYGIGEKSATFAAMVALRDRCLAAMSKPSPEPPQ